MNIEIDGTLYAVSSDLLLTLFDGIASAIPQFYQALIPKPMRILAMPIAREALRRLEPEYGKEARPSKGADPNLHLICLLLSKRATGMDNVTLHLETDATNSITSFYLSVSNTGKGRGSMVDHGFVRIRQNDGSEIIRRILKETVSDC